MSANVIKDHNNIIAGIATGNLIDENLHAIAVNMKQYQAVKGSINGTDCTVSVSSLSPE